MAQIFQLPKVIPLSVGRVLPGAKLTFYLTGTSTLTNIYTDDGLSVAHSNPVVADANGVFAPIYLNPEIRYRATLTTSADVLVYTVDPVNDSLLTQAQIGAILNPQTPGELAASKTPSAYFYVPGDRARGDIRRYGVTSGSSAAAVANAVQDALASHNYAFIPGDDWAWNPVLFTASRQRIIGDGFRTQLVVAGAGIGIDFDGYAGCAVEDLVMYSSTAAVGIDVGPNAGQTRFAHWWRLKRVMAVGNTPNWASTSLASARAGFATSAIQIQKAFYGEAEHCETSFAVGNGFRLFEQANGNTFSGCHARDNAVGLKIEGTGSGNTNGNTWQGGNIEASIANSIGIDIGEADRNRFTGRMEISATGGKHIRVNPPSGTAAQDNNFDMALTGSSAGYELGDGSGSSQVRGTMISGGPFGSSIVINSDCLNTVLMASPSGISGVSITDNGYGTIMRGDLGGGKWYERPVNQNTAAYNHDLLVGTGSVDESLGDNAKTMQFTSFANAFQWKKIDASGTNLAVMMFGGYRLWISPTNGKLYLKSSDPTTHDDGTVVGTQT
jgi:hypothetical protein